MSPSITRVNHVTTSASEWVLIVQYHLMTIKSCLFHMHMHVSCSLIIIYIYLFFWEGGGVCAMGFFNLDVVFPLLKLQRYVCDDKILSAAPVWSVFSNREDQVCCNGQHVFVQIWACLTCCVGIWDVQTVVMCLLINKGSAGNMCGSAEWRRQKISPWVTSLDSLSVSGYSSKHSKDSFITCQHWMRRKYTVYIYIYILVLFFGHQI